MTIFRIILLLLLVSSSAGFILTQCGAQCGTLTVRQRGFINMKLYGDKNDDKESAKPTINWRNDTAFSDRPGGEVFKAA